MLIVLEGLDGAGKSTQLKMVSNYMESCGHKVEYLHFPRFDAPVFGDLIARFLRGDFGSIEQVHPQLVALLFAEDRRDAGPMLRKWLDEGRCVILDRYYYSNIAFQCSKLESAEEARLLRDWIIDVELGYFGIPTPDLNLFLDVPIKFVDSKLSASRHGDDRAYLEGKNDIHEADIAFQVKVRDIYLEQCALDESFKRIDCSDGNGNMLPANDIFIKIRKEIEALS
ncbi:MAG: thymidylate kinase [Bacteroidales bacterium]|jgi:dTMP kinase|nr:thymidylate kinase [Bacteroidales bacterium]